MIENRNIVYVNIKKMVDAQENVDYFWIYGGEFLKPIIATLNCF